MNIKPTIGRIVLYKLSESDAEQINRRREALGSQGEGWPKGAQEHVGNQVKQGDVFPMMITRVWESEEEHNGVNGQVFLDGNDVLWATSASQGSEGHEWDWMPYQKDQQARLSNEEKETDKAQVS